MGRKALEITEKEINRRKTSGLRIKSLRKTINYTQENLAEELGISVATIRNYEYGIYPVPKEYIRKLSELSKGDFCEEYLSGETEIKTQAAYNKFCDENEWWPDPDEDNRTHSLKEKRIRKILFAACGYRYIGEGMAEYDFMEIIQGTESPKESNMLEPMDGSSPVMYFTDDEINSLITELKDHISFTCYKKGKLN